MYIDIKNVLIIHIVAKFTVFVSEECSLGNAEPKSVYFINRKTSGIV